MEELPPKVAALVSNLKNLVKDSPAAKQVLADAVATRGKLAIFDPDVHAAAGAAKLAEILAKGKASSSV